jgi:cbb3-type cytochrome oxidase maturation protein
MTAGLSAAGIKLSIFSGDATAAAKRVGAALGIADARGGLSPEDKHAALKALQDAGETVAMVGDGVNDAPVLARAQVSIAMGGGADLARANADVVLLGNDLQRTARRAGAGAAHRAHCETESRLGLCIQFPRHPAGHGGLGDALDGRHRHVGQFAAGGAQRLAAAAEIMHGMDILYLLIPLSLVLVFVIAALFWWSLKTGQYEDLKRRTTTRWCASSP